MRIIIVSTMVGFGIEVLFLIDVLGWISWCPGRVFQVLHHPSILVEGALFQRGSVLWGNLPFATLQWPIMGTVVGLILNLAPKSATPPLQRTPDSASASNSGPSGRSRHEA